ncbi:MAG TPA: VOC family protein [Candidatus Yaniella excrementavium]|nr:VOC family protein [Candidatus Yaniella excrementavium]
MQTHTPQLAMITLDCADPEPVSRFWSELLGWQRVYLDENAAMLQGPDQAIGFGRVANYAAPVWPNERGSKQFHFDVAVDDISAAAQYCIELGAHRPVEQPGDTWVVLIDPAGHPFCLTDAANW